MSLNIIDLRSDTVTEPCINMRRAIYKAKVGDNFYNEDYITQELEEYCANYFNMEAGLFMISGTMSNQVAIRCHTKPGDEIIADNYYHIIYYESGPTADLGKVSTNLIYTRDGIITKRHLSACLMNKHRSALTSFPKLLCLENTINHYSGKIYPFDKLKQVSLFAKSKGISVHLDGARLLNACIATGIEARQYSQFVDSIMFTFSKGLCAPTGSILLGKKEFIKRAKIYQKWYGGGMHQSGILAAAALFGIKNNIERLAVDNDNAKLLAKLLAKDKRLNVVPEKIETNIVMFSVKQLNISAIEFINLVKAKGVLLYPWSNQTVRAVTHRGIDKDAVKNASKIIMSVASSF